MIEKLIAKFIQDITDMNKFVKKTIRRKKNLFEKETKKVKETTDETSKNDRKTMIPATWIPSKEWIKK